jgi:beta-N-acetylhexosaminidase
MKNYLYGRLMVDIEGTQLLDQERQLLQNPHVGGIILFARNIQSRMQLINLVKEIREVADPILIAVDQEGGRVQRFQEDFTRLPAMQVLGDFVEQDSRQGLDLARDVGWLMAAEVLACGLDISFAPVLDVDRETSSIIGDRAFSDQAQQVVKVAKAFIEGMSEAGMAATGKHFPGHGGIVADSHLEAPVDNRLLSDLQHRDMLPFTQLSDCLGAIMTAHITFPEIDVHSVGFSPFWLQEMLRNQIGFQGVIFSDDLTMKGADIVGGYKQKAKMALEAGCDMILVCNSPQGVLEVLDYMQWVEISGCEKVAQMRAQTFSTWHQLTAQARYTETKIKLKDLIVTGN